MNTRLLHIASLAVLLSTLLPSQARLEPEKELLRLDLQVFRIQGDISGDLSMTELMYVDEQKRPVATQQAFTLFTRAKATFAGIPFRADDKGWFWEDNREIPFGAPRDPAPFKDEQRIALIAQPSAVMEMGDNATIDLSSEQTIQYFERQKDNLFELKTVKQPTGLTFRVKIVEGSNKRLLLKDMTISSRIIEERKPIDGVSLNVGPPIVNMREFTTTLNLAREKDYGMLLHASQGQGVLLIRFRISPQPRPTPTPPPESK